MVMMVATLLSNVIVIRWLAPDDAGVWQTLTLVLGYSMIIQFGMMNGLQREYPVLAGRGQLDEALRMCATTLAHILVCSALVFVGFLTAGFVLGGDRWLLGFSTMAVVGAATFYASYLATTYRTTVHFGHLANVQLVYSVLLLVTVTPVFLWEFEGLCVRLIVLALGNTALLHRSRPIRVRPKFEWAAAKPLLTAGIPMVIYSHMVVVSDGFVRVVLLGTGGVLLVGLFAPAQALRGAMAALPGSINQYLTPRLGMELGKTDDPQKLWEASWKGSVATTLALIPVGVIAWFAVPWGIELIFPKYTAGTRAAQLMAVAATFYGVRVGTAAMAVLKAWAPLYTYGGITAALLWILPSYFAGEMDPLEGVAIGAIWARAISFFLGLVCIYWATHRKSARSVAS